MDILKNKIISLVVISVLITLICNNNIFFFFPFSSGFDGANNDYTALASEPIIQSVSSRNTTTPFDTSSPSSSSSNSKANLQVISNTEYALSQTLFDGAVTIDSNIKLYPNSEPVSPTINVNNVSNIYYVDTTFFIPYSALPGEVVANLLNSAPTTPAPPPPSAPTPPSSESQYCVGGGNTTTCYPAPPQGVGNATTASPTPPSSESTQSGGNASSTTTSPPPSIRTLFGGGNLTIVENMTDSEIQSAIDSTFDSQIHSRQSIKKVNDFNPLSSSVPTAATTTTTSSSATIQLVSATHGGGGGAATEAAGHGVLAKIFHVLHIGHTLHSLYEYISLQKEYVEFTKRILEVEECIEHPIIKYADASQKERNQRLVEQTKAEVVVNGIGAVFYNGVGAGGLSVGAKVPSWLTVATTAIGAYGVHEFNYWANQSVSDLERAIPKCKPPTHEVPRAGCDNPPCD
jgi:hypothetical protein